jgi:hypothetical protein
MALPINLEHSLVSLYSIHSVGVDLVELPDAPINFGAVITTPPTNIQTDQPVEVRFKWTQQGFDALFPQPYEFQLQVFLEGMGPAPELQFNKNVAYLTGNPRTYSEKVEIPAGVISPGIYRVTAAFMLAYTTPPATGQTPIAGFVDLGLVQWYRAD